RRPQQRTRPRADRSWIAPQLERRLWRRGGGAGGTAGAHLPRRQCRSAVRNARRPRWAEALLGGVVRTGVQRAESRQPAQLQRRADVAVLRTGNVGGCGEARRSGNEV